MDSRTLIRLVAVFGTLLLATAVLWLAGPRAADDVLPPAAWTQWLAFLSNAIKVLEGGAFAFGAYQVFKGRKERQRADAEAAVRAVIDSNYQAWQVINSAQGKGGSGGRIEALHALLRNRVSLAGITLDHAWLEGVTLPNAELTRASFRGTNLLGADFAGAHLAGADFTDANLMSANLAGAHLKGANVTGARLSAAILDGADVSDLVGWREVRSISHTSLENVLRAPLGFVTFAREYGAIDISVETHQTVQQEGFSREFRAV